MAKKGEFILTIGDDNVVLIRMEDKKVANAWLASPDPATALEELGEALAEDKKGKVSILIDTLDQTFKEEEIPRVGVLDRRKVLSRHITMAFPGQNMRGARFVGDGPGKKTLNYEFAAVPLDGRIPGWIEFYDSLPNVKGGVHILAAENVDLISALGPKDAPVEQGNHWRHFIGINVTGGLRQIIEKNGRLSLTRLTQAPPPETPPDEFADMIVRDFKATITYLRRLGYVVGDPLDLVIVTTSANRDAMENLTWDGARSVTIQTPHEAAAMLGLGAIGPEDQAHCDVLHAVWFAHKGRSAIPLTRSVAMGDAKDDIRELAFLVSPYAAGVAIAALIGWTGLAAYELFNVSQESDRIVRELTQVKSSLTTEQAQVAELPYDAATLRNVFDVEDAMENGRIDVIPDLTRIYDSLQSDAVVLKIEVQNVSSADPGSSSRRNLNAGATGYTITINLRLAPVITSANEAVTVTRQIRQRLVDQFNKGYQVELSKEPVAAQAASNLSGGLFDSAAITDAEGNAIRSDEPFYAEFVITRGATS
ncbi:MAG: hypothetical protein KDE14_12920 [Rhodobacteraceae bacterium]|nr:hypothetical protein [Paracoccaceae bacterium]